MKKFSLKINAITEYVYEDGKPETESSFEKVITISIEETTADFYNSMFTLLRDELLASFNK